MIGHAWPLTQGDAKTRGRKRTARTHIYATDRGAKGARPVRNRRAHRSPLGGSRGQLRLSLTNTYHEWPVYSSLSVAMWTLPPVVANIKQMSAVNRQNLSPHLSGLVAK